jgi:hypothetical protein
MLSLVWACPESKDVIDLSDIELKDHVRIYVLMSEFVVRNNEVQCSMSIRSAIQYDTVMNC